MDKKVLIRALLLGFIPVIVYVVIESGFGPEWGMAAAFAWSLGEMALIYLREKRWEKFLLFDIGLIAALGSVSLLFHDDFFFKLKPAVFELVFLVVIGLSRWGNVPIIQNMSARQLRRTGMKVDTENPVFQKMLTGMFFLLAVHVAAVVWAALFASTEMWGFISGALLYILFGIWAAGQILPRFIRPFYWKFRYADDEWLPVLDASTGRVLFSAPRKLVHRNGEWLHPVVHVNIVNSRGEWYLQKRLKSKRAFPGYWDVSVGGHIETGENIERAGERETLEEIGLKITVQGPPDYIYQLKAGSDWELVHVFLVETDVEPEPNPAELEKGQFWQLRKIREDAGEEKFTPAVKAELAMVEKLIAGNRVNPYIRKKSKKRRKK